MEYSNDDYFTYYKKKKKEKLGKNIGRKEYVLSADFKKILYEYYSHISRMMIYDAYAFYSPNRVGEFNIVKYKPTMLTKDGELRKEALKVDWATTKSSWEKIYGMKYDVDEFKKIKDKPLVYFSNDHSDGWEYRWNWNKITSTLKNQSKMYFKPSRTNKRLLATAIKSITSLDFSEGGLKHNNE